MRSQSLFLLLALVACSKDGKDDPVDEDGVTPDDGDADTDADADSDTDADTDADCAASVVSIVPADGETLVPLDTQVIATFDQAIADPAPFGIDVGSAVGTTEIAADGLSMTWTGTLEPNTLYTVTASVCDSSLTSEFTTLPPPLDLSSLTGNTYALVWDELSISEPGNELLLNTFIDVPFVLAQLLEFDETTLLADAVGTTGSDDGTGTPVPDCDLDVRQTADFTLNPFFRIDGTIAIPIDADGNTTDVENFSLLARMADDGGSITDVQLSGLIATEEILGAGEDCVNGQLIQLLNPTCQPCTTSLTGQCMLFEGTAPAALLAPTLDIAGTCGP